MKTLNVSDIPQSARYSDVLVKISSFIWARIKTERDDTSESPWEQCDGHGPVSEWTSRDKAAGERVLCSDHGRKRYYDFAAAIQLAKSDGWGLATDKLASLESGLGRKATAGEIRAASVESDFEFLRGWCNDKWEYIGVTVTLEDNDGLALSEESLWGIESLGDYWRETAAEIANSLAAAHVKALAKQQAEERTESAERSYWEARDTVTL